ncbi:MAG: hypothetical protein ACYS21_08385, partial [Planctomycetota bacterium]
MCKKLIYLIFFMVILVLAGEPVWGADLAAYWDSRYPAAWATATATQMRDALQTAGYTVLDADELKTWMDAHIPGGAGSVVVFCQDIVPDTVAETMSATCTIRRYLDAGGKVVWYSDWPFYYVGHSGPSQDTWDAAGATAILGFDAATGPGDSWNVVALTPDGVDWGLTETWQSRRPTSPTVTTNLTVLATDNAGNAAAWVKHYVPGDIYGGFVRYFDVDTVVGTRVPNYDDVQRLAEYRLGPFPYASKPSPADGSTIDGLPYPPDYIYAVMTFTAGDFAVYPHEVF